ncbi:SLOG family protein [Paenibacillus sp. USHLN196]|uniref:SLOG family protein n=1 Tax=Paenibacillus sp. USHLN196 TaxID=3081291 RepID=UPI00301A5E2E
MVDFAYLNSPEGKEEMNRRREERREQEEIEFKTVSFTGHRPNKLGNCYSLTDSQSKYIKSKLEPVLIQLIENEGIENFVSGGAIGFDQIAFWTVQGLKKTDYPNICNIVAVPFKNQAIKWTDRETQHWYKKMIEVADGIVYVDELPEYKVEGVPIGDYHVAKMQKRNEYMVDKSRIIISTWDGTKGGTGNCCRYVRKVGKTLYNLKPQYDFDLDVTYGFNG